MMTTAGGGTGGNSDRSVASEPTVEAVTLVADGIHNVNSQEINSGVLRGSAHHGAERARRSPRYCQPRHDLPSAGRIAFTAWAITTNSSAPVLWRCDFFALSPDAVLLEHEWQTNVGRTGYQEPDVPFWRLVLRAHSIRRVHSSHGTERFPASAGSVPGRD